MEKVSLFDFISNVNEGRSGKNLMVDVKVDPDEMPGDCVSKTYSTFMVNRAMSQHADTIFIAQELNLLNSLHPKMHYDFARNVIRGKKRYGKWAKSPKDPVMVELLMEHYNYNRRRALEALDLMTKEDLNKLKKRYDQGGRTK